MALHTDPTVDGPRTSRERAITATSLIGAVAAISFAAVFFRLAQPTHPLVAAGWRLILASLLLLPWTLRACRRGLNRRLVRHAMLGGLFYGLHFGTWVASLALTSVAASVTLVTSTPLLLGLFALITRRDLPSRRLWLATTLALVGVAIVGAQGATSGGHQRLLGDLLALLGAGGMAAYLVTGRRLGEQLALWPFMGIATAVGGGLLLASAGCVGISLRPSSPSAMLYIALAALLPQLVGHSLLTWSLRRVSPTVVGMATVGEPVGATLLAWIILAETPPLGVGLGCVVIIVAMLLALSSRADLSIEKSPRVAKIGKSGHRRTRRPG